jgi:hypothetical protein
MKLQLKKVVDVLQNGWFGNLSNHDTVCSWVCVYHSKHLERIAKIKGIKLDKS